MKIDTIPYFKFPVQVIFLDNDELFLDAIKKYITNDNKNNLMSTNVEAILMEINNFHPICADTSVFLYDVNLDEIDDDEHLNVSVVNYKEIVNLVYNKQRFQEKAVFVVDYSMPSMNGIEFFQRMGKFFAKKIMLTGHDDHKVAINAFNDRLIDKYMLKEINSVRNDPNNIIDEAIIDYFCSFSGKIFPLSKVHTNEQYTRIFEKWLDKNKILEFYQCDDIGSYLGIDDNGNLFWLLLCNDGQINKYIGAASNAKLSKNLIDDLIERRRLLFLYSEREKNYPIERWEEYMFKISGSFVFDDINYYYAFITNESFSLDQTKIVPFIKR